MNHQNKCVCVPKLTADADTMTYLNQVWLKLIEVLNGHQVLAVPRILLQSAPKPV